MRRSTFLILLLMLLPGCHDAGRPGYTIVDGFLKRAARLDCRPVHVDGEYAVAEMRGVSDSTWTVLDEAQRTVALFDDELRRLWEVSYVETGPGAVEEPVSAVPAGDTAVAIAGRGNLRLVLLSLDGRELRSTPLDFAPASLAETGDGSFLVTAMPFGPSPPTLLERWRGDTLSPVDIPKRAYTDMVVAALGNTALVEVLSDGTALVVHQFLEPRAFALYPGGSVRQLALPTPDATRDRIDFIPTAPVTEAQMLEMLVPAIAMSLDRRSDEVYVMTRTNQLTGSRPERALLRLDRQLRFIQGFITDVPATAMAYLPRKRTVLLVDDEDGFHACKLPPAPELATDGGRTGGAPGPEPGS